MFTLEMSLWCWNEDRLYGGVHISPLKPAGCVETEAEASFGILIGTAKLLSELKLIKAKRPGKGNGISG